MTATAISLDRVSRVVGYVIKKGNFAEASPNLPQRIVILGEANDSHQSGLETDATEVTSLRQAGELYGYGSPIYQAMRILRPRTSDGVGGIPTIVIAQPSPVGAAAKIIEINVSGSATKNVTHNVIIAGRDNVDASSYAINVENGDTVAMITAKIAAAVNNVLGSPVTASDFGYSALLTSKWKGLTANEISVRVDVGDDAAGLTYTIEGVQNGSATPDIDLALAQFGNTWYTIVLNTYGLVSSIMNALQDFNGIPDPAAPTGRYVGIVFKPFIAFSGSVSEDPSAITDARLDDVTIAVCPAPLSEGLSMEAAANMVVLFARVAQDTPELDVAGKSYPDMPTPTDIGLMADYNERDAIVKKGCSTVDLVSGKYQVQDLVTTYHKEGEEPPQFRYCRNINLDWNVRYGYYLLELQYVLDHAIANDNDEVDAAKVVKPKIWKSILDDYGDSLAKRALIVDSTFMQNSIQVAISTTNPDRFETTFRYKRSGFVRQAATVAEAGFNFGTGVNT